MVNMKSGLSKAQDNLFNKVKDYASLIKSIRPGTSVCPKEIVGGLIVSTILGSDNVYETAIMDRHGTYPVERYDSRQEAEDGHESWAEWALASNNEVTKLGYKNIVADEKVSLSRMTEEEVRALYDALK